VIPDPILVGRNAEKLKNSLPRNGVKRWTTDLDGRSGTPTTNRFFRRCLDKAPSGLLKKASPRRNTSTARTRRHLVRPSARPVSAPESGQFGHGVVQDKLWLRGC